MYLILSSYLMQISCTNRKSSETSFKNIQEDSSLSQQNIDPVFPEKKECYTLSFHYITPTGIESDTSFNVRKYLTEDDNRLIFCNDSIYFPDIEQLIWNSEYISLEQVEYGKSRNMYIMDYYLTENSEIIAGITRYMPHRSLLIKMIKLKIYNAEIVGINKSPEFSSEFKYFKDLIITHTDMIMMNL